MIGNNSTKSSNNDDKINFMNECLRPLLIYSLYTSGCYQFSNSKNLFRLYSYLLCAIMMLTTIRYITVFDYYPNNFAKTVASFAYILGFTMGCIGLLQLNRIQSKIYQISSLLDDEQRLANNYSRRRKTRQITFRWCILYMCLIICGSIANLIIRLLTTIDIMKMPTYMFLFGRNNLLSSIDIPLSYFVLSPIFTLAAFLTIICDSIRIQLKQIGDDMVDDRTRQIETIERYHQRYQKLFEAKELLGDAYSLILFSFVAIVIPMMCFVIYAGLHSQSNNFSDSSVYIFYSILMLQSLIIFYRPVFLLLEEGNRLLSVVFHVSTTETEPTSAQIATSIQFLAFRIVNAPMSIVSCEIFVLNRSFLIKSISIIVTYFALMIQIGDNTKRSSPLLMLQRTYNSMNK